ncbi:MAG: polysaccharide biosynthesis/export family protein [Gemmataceae bacterium]|nr:polysaccharide biosynthesis/export family protein [Gemmataceae bacterium]
MERICRGLSVVWLSLACLICLGSAGCMTCGHCKPCDKHAPADTPRELAKLSLPAYVIEPPDILLIDAVRVVPLPPYKVQPLDVLFIQATDTLPNEPINGLFSVEPEGRINLGASYGVVEVTGMTVDDARAAIEKQLKLQLKNPKVVVALAQARAMQQIRGEHLVRPDGTVSLGIYGSAYVAGMTLEDAKAHIEAHLSQFLLQPEVSVDVFAYNSKVFYLIFDGGGYGQQVFRLPVTGNETVLDAVSQLNGLPAVSSKKHIWVARPQHNCGAGCDQVMPVDWTQIVECGRTETNYQLFPGDRVYVKADSLIATDNWLAKVISPVERVLGVTLLGATTVNTIRTNPNRNFGNNGVIIAP